MGLGVGRVSADYYDGIKRAQARSRESRDSGLRNRTRRQERSRRCSLKRRYRYGVGRVSADYYDGIKRVQARSRESRDLEQNKETRDRAGVEAGQSYRYRYKAEPQASSRCVRFVGTKSRHVS